MARRNFGGQNPLHLVRVASTGNVNIASAPSTIDGVSLIAGDLILLKDQTTASENGIYRFVALASALVIDADTDTSKQIHGMPIIVVSGTINTKHLFTLVSNSPAVFHEILLSSLRNNVSGLQIDYDTDNSYIIGIGNCRDSTYTFNIIADVAPLSVSLAVSGAGGLDTGVEAASTWYAVHLIGDSAGVNAAAGLVSLSPTAPSLPAGYDRFRRIGWVRNDASSNLRPQSTSGSAGNRETFYLDSIASRAVLTGGAAQGVTLVSMATLIPPPANSADVKVRESGTADLFIFATDGVTLVDGYLAGNEATFEYPVAGTQNIYYGHSGAGGVADMWVFGYEEEL